MDTENELRSAMRVTSMLLLTSLVPVNPNTDSHIINAGGGYIGIIFDEEAAVAVSSSGQMQSSIRIGIGI